MSPCLSGVPQLGRISFPTSGSPSAQPHFLRGVLLLHSFEYDEAIDVFRDAERADPGFAMAYWGEAMCYNQPLWYNENLDKARAALERLASTRTARAAKAPTGREKGYLDAVERLYGDGSRQERALAYLARMADLSREYPDDDEAAAFHALALVATIPDGGRNPAVSLRAGAIASAILKKNPQHPGAAHYALHAYDDGEHARLGLTAARIYATIAPASSHARHMPSHVFLPLGMWDDAARSDESAWAASLDQVKRRGVSLAQADFHSLTWLQYEYLQQGRFTKAGELLEPVKLALERERGSGAAPRDSPVASGFSRTDEHQHVESEIGRGYGPLSLRSEAASMRARLLVESRDWAQMKGHAGFDNVDELFALGMSSAKLGDLARAEAAVDQMQRAPTAAPDADNRELARIMELELEGLVESARGQRSRALAPLAQAAALEAGRRRPNARPYPIKPAGELYAEALLADGDAQGAWRQFRQALARTPNRASSLLGLARALQSAGRRAEAAEAAKNFLAMWHAADRARPELAEARAIAGR